MLGTLSYFSRRRRRQTRRESRDPSSISFDTSVSKTGRHFVCLSYTIDKFIRKFDFPISIDEIKRL